MSDWTEFQQDIASRFLLPLESYTFQVNFVEFNPTTNDLIDIKQKLTSVAVEVVQASPDPSLQSLRQVDLEGAYYTLHYGNPTFDFSISLTGDALIFSKQKFQLEDLVNSIPMFEMMADRLFSPNSDTSMAQHVFFRRSYRTSHRFRQRISLGSRMSDQAVMRTNIEVMKFLTNQSDDSVVGWLAPDRIIRNDFMMSCMKIFDGHPANIWLNAEAPYNGNQRELSLDYSLRRGDGPGSAFLAQHLFEHRTVLTHFLKDIILTRIFPNLFHDTHVLPSI